MTGVIRPAGAGKRRPAKTAGSKVSSARRSGSMGLDVGANF
jgi:hypothetical protein